MTWWLWILLVGFIAIAIVVVAQMYSGAWIGDAVKEGLDKWSDL
jgi:hypothetical protein